MVGDGRGISVRVAARLKIKGCLTANTFDHAACQVTL